MPYGCGSPLKEAKLNSTTYNRDRDVVCVEENAEPVEVYNEHDAVVCIAPNEHS